MIISQIHNAYNSLTPTEKRIAAYILKYPKEVVHMSAKQLASECKTVASAVDRTCKSLGKAGFAELKIELAVDLGGRDKVENHLPFSKNDTPKTVLKKVFSSGINTLKSTQQMLDFDNMLNITNIITSAKRVFMFGVGTSAIIATDAAYRFSELGIHAYAYTDFSQMNIMAKYMEKGDVALCVSHSGNTKVMIDSTRSAKEAGAITIGLTSFSKSHLAKECDKTIIVYADEKNYPVEAVSARIAQMCVVDALMMMIASVKYDDFTKYTTLRNQVYEEIRYQ